MRVRVMEKHFTAEDEVFLYETFAKLTNQVLPKDCMFLEDENDIPLSDFFWFEKDIADCQSPTDTIPPPDSSQPLFPLSYCHVSSPSSSDSPISINSSLQQDNEFTRYSPPPPLSPTSPTMPFSPPSPNPQSPDYLLQTAYRPSLMLADSASVHFIDLKETYEKTQVRRGGTSEQRLVDCRVHMFASFSETYIRMEVHVHRHPKTGEVEDKMLFPVTVEKTLPNMQYFSINLDAVYLTSLGTRFYQLSTTDRFRRNRFIIDVSMIFADNSRANFQSEPFLVRSRKQSPNPRKKRSYTQ